MLNSSIKTSDFHTYPDGRMNTSNTSLYMGYALKTLAMMRSKGTGPKYVKRGKVFYYREDVDAWMVAAKVSSTAQKNQNKESI